LKGVRLRNVDISLISPNEYYKKIIEPFNDFKGRQLRNKRFSESFIPLEGEE
jgi:hypothetical protein